MKKIVITKSLYFFLSKEALEEMAVLKKIEGLIETDKYGIFTFFRKDGSAWLPTFERDDPDLIATIEKLGCEKASGYGTVIAIVEIPDSVAWRVASDCDDSGEYVVEKHREWHANSRTGVTQEIKV